MTTEMEKSNASNPKTTPAVTETEIHPRSAESEPPKPKSSAWSPETEPIVSYDDNLLERTRTQWQFGDWQSLAKIQTDSLEHHPDRAILALLSAAGNLQMDRMAQARQLITLAQIWGCDKKMISRILISGVYNSLGRAAIAIGHKQRSNYYYEAYIDTVSSDAGDVLIGQDRLIIESIKMGLLPQATEFIGEQLRKIKESRLIDKSRLAVLETELALVSNELSLALQRQQLPIQKYSNKTDAAVEGSPEWLANIQKKAVSQLGQELWVLEKTGYKRNGFFVEFGAADGVLLSNSWLLEKEFDWKGICAEPNPKFFAKLKKNRQCIVSESCIAGETGKQVEFVFADVYGGMREYADDDRHKEKRADYHASGQTKILTTISLHDFLLKHQAPKDIDYLSIDTEGSEFEILRNFPFDQWNIRLLTVEHNFTERRKDIRELLERHNYRCTEKNFDDWYEYEG